MLPSILIITIINLLGLIWCYSQQSDKATDLFYCLSFLVLTSFLWWTYADSLAHHLLFLMITLWGVRLGGYLFVRIHAMGSDQRFDKMRKKFLAIAGFWTLQAASILILAIPIIILFQKPNIPFHWVQVVGGIIWLVGWLLETIADYQKFHFRSNSVNDGQFVAIGLWKQIQHPNYLGEMLCWIGVFVLTMPSLEGLEWLAIISPIWISILLVFISGIPLLQKASQKKYGHLESYQHYQKRTAYLLPFIY